MKEIALALASTVIFLFSADGHTPIGTAFIVGMPLDSDKTKVVPLVVTAKHVVAGQQRIVGRFNPRGTGRPIEWTYDLQKLRSDGDLWVHSDNAVDIVVFRTLHAPEAGYGPLPLDLVASQETVESEEIGPMDRVVFPSLLLNLMGMPKNYPVIRDGSIALLPNEAVPIRYELAGSVIESSQHLILLNASSFPGASGAPVFLAPVPRQKGKAYQLGGTRPLLLGIMHGFYPAAPQGLLRIQSTEAKLAFTENSGIAVAFPAWRLLEILQQPAVTMRIRSLATGSR